MKKKQDQDEKIIQETIQLLVWNRNKGGAWIVGKCAEKFGISRSQSEKFLSEARRRITETAVFNRSYEAGASLTTLRTIRDLAMSKGETKNALAAESEIIQLLGLRDRLEEKEEDESPDLTEIRRQLKPLFPDEDIPVTEMARRLALKWTEKNDQED